MASIRYATLLSTTLLLGSCTKEDEPMPAPVYLLDQRWILRELNGQTAPSSASELLLNSVDGSNRGKSFCNQYGGNYTLPGGSPELRFSEQFSTYATCAQQDQETLYLSLLPRVARYTIRERQLFLYNDTSAEPLLVFVAAE
ncbi:META domain-containing protein [Hymenobacter endophyticus]|uniref:META domain-containing protein n=1 Tax=Hymenobacter endophyticus TaxID=3076335 RepID=A0ABU3TE37_9BACT|nr:META domain-containing protein [Hymenobacter endophyticus]MDU0369634.1 META domain-containing protein [Hymenobacter endophyticus]